jgi:hypothetical protein
VDFELIRDRMDEDEKTPGVPDTEPGTSRFVGRVVSTLAAELAVGKFTTMQPIRIYGQESTTATATTEDTGPTMAVLWLGPNNPVTSQIAIAKRVPHRWVAQHGSPNSSLCITVTSCGTVKSGATITIRRSSDSLLVATGTTGGTGLYCTTVPCPETYDFTADYSTCTSTTVTRTVSCSSTNVTIEVGAVSGSTCLTGCACTSIPTTLHLTSTGPCDGVFLPCTIVYGPTPANLSGINLGANCYLSNETFVDALSGLSYRYVLACDTIFFRLSRVYLPTYTSGPFHDSSIYSWSIGQPGNTCAGTPTPTSPFLLSSGYIYPGGNTTCIVSIG